MTPKGVCAQVLKLAAGSAAGGSALWGLLAQFYRCAPNAQICKTAKDVHTSCPSYTAAAPHHRHVVCADWRGCDAWRGSHREHFDAAGRELAMCRQHSTWLKF